eukprot:6189427-Pleurochrysis_carterae.AAC.2
MRAYNVTIERSQDAIGWVGLLSIPSIGCITPPPFGTQCTLPRELALEACLRTRACTAITCPSQEPYERGQRAKKIAGPICQLRSRADTSNAEKRHGMCRPSGCVNVLMHPVQVDPAWRRTVAEAGASHRSVLLFVTASSPGLIPPYALSPEFPCAFLHSETATLFIYFFFPLPQLFTANLFAMLLQAPVAIWLFAEQIRPSFRDASCQQYPGFRR